MNLSMEGFKVKLGHALVIPFSQSMFCFLQEKLLQV